MGRPQKISNEELSKINGETIRYWATIFGVSYSTVWNLKVKGVEFGKDKRGRVAKPGSRKRKRKPKIKQGKFFNIKENSNWLV